MAEQYGMAEFLSLVAIGAVGVSQDGRTMLDTAGVPMPRPELDERARRAVSNGWVVEVARRVGLTANGRAALRTLRATTKGVVPDDAEFHRRVAEHARWVDAFLDPRDRWDRSVAPADPPAPARAPAPTAADLAPPGTWSGPTGTLLFTPRAAGPSWTVELSRLDAVGVVRALSAAQTAELRALLDRVRAALG